MNIVGLQKLTLLDFPGKVACTVFLGGCNFRCPFCHNSQLLENPPAIMEQEALLNYLKSRTGILDGVCITGGEPTLQPDLEELLNDPSRPIFVAAEEKLLGYCFCIIEEVKDDPVLRDVKSLYIDDLCVDETIRGRHVGSRLYDHVCGYARSIGCRSVTLNVWCGNDSAMKFYESRGMKPRKIYMETSLERN